MEYMTMVFYNDFAENASDKEATPVLFCDWCGEPIYAGDDYYKIISDCVCENCIHNRRTTADF